MKVDSINRYINPRTTGYSALAGFALTAATGMGKNKQFKRMHKPLFWISAAATAIHIGQIEYMKHKFKKN